MVLIALMLTNTKKELILMTFGDWLREELRIRSFTQKALAQHAQVDESTISRLISGKREPDPDICVKIADFLGIPYEDVFRRSGLLPPTPGPEEDKMLEDTIALFKLLNPQQRREVLEYAYYRLIRQQRHSVSGQEAPGSESDDVP